jgi:hypothetical protein
MSPEGVGISSGGVVRGVGHGALYLPSSDQAPGVLADDAAHHRDELPPGYGLQCTTPRSSREPPPRGRGHGCRAHRQVFTQHPVRPTSLSPPPATPGPPPRGPVP